MQICELSLASYADINAIYESRPFGKSWSVDGLVQPYNETHPQQQQPGHDPLDVWYSRRPRIQRPGSTNNPSAYNTESHYDYPPNLMGDHARSIHQQGATGPHHHSSYNLNQTQQHFYDDPYAHPQSQAPAGHLHPVPPPAAAPYDPYMMVGTEPRRGRRGARNAMDQRYRQPINYNDPNIKRILITKEPNTHRSARGVDGMGLKVIGGKLLPGSDGEIGAYVAAVYKPAMVETMGQVKEGDQILEWNGIPLTGKTFEETQRCVDESSGEVEVVIKSNAHLNQIYSMKNSQSVDKGYESAPDSYPGNMAYPLPPNQHQYHMEDPYSVPVNQKQMVQLAGAGQQQYNPQHQTLNPLAHQSAQSQHQLHNPNNLNPQLQANQQLSCSQPQLQQQQAQYGNQYNDSQLQAQQQHQRKNQQTQQRQQLQLQNQQPHQLQNQQPHQLQNQQQHQLQNQQQLLPQHQAAYNTQQQPLAPNQQNEQGALLAPPVPPHRNLDGHASPYFNGEAQQHHHNQLQLQQQGHYEGQTALGSRQQAQAYQLGQGVSAVQVSGQVKVGVSFERSTNTLFVSVYSGRELSTRPNGQSPSPFVKIYLLPGRRVENKRRSKYIMQTIDPDWNQTVVYKDLDVSLLPSHYLEFTVWDYDKQGHNMFLGQIILSLGDISLLNGQAHWYRLNPRDQTQTMTQQQQAQLQQQPAGLWPIANEEFTGYYSMTADQQNGNYYADGSY